MIQNREMKFYLSGKIGNDKNRTKYIKELENAAIYLRQIGMNVISPLEIIVDQEKYPWEEYLKHDIQEMLNCDGIIILRNWSNSPGARLELFIASTLGLKVLYYEEL